MISNFLLLARSIAPLLYIVAAGGIVLAVRALWQARATLSQAQFRLEREQAEEKAGGAITRLVVFVQAGILVYLISTVMFDTWRDLNTTGEEAPPAEQAAEFRTAVPLEGDEGFVVPTRPADGLVLPQTPVPSPTPAGTLLPADDALGCIADQANIRLPGNGQVIYETESIIGTANIAEFGYYRFEIRNVETGRDFGVIGGVSSDYTSPVTDGPLGNIVPQNFAPGEYRFRMMVFDTSGISRAACEITLFMSDPIPTATPIGGGAPAAP